MHTPSVPHEAAQALLEVNKLNVSINGKPILKDIDVSLNKGDVLGVIGESGSGKSMLALSMMCLLPEGFEASGQIKFDQRDLLQLDEAKLCQLRGGDISMVFQEPMTALNPVLSIGRQVTECIQLHRSVSGKQAKKIAEQTLEKSWLAGKPLSPRSVPP